MNSKQLFSEELIRLPRCFLLYESIYQREPVKLKETVSNTIILGSLNKEPKNSIQTLNTWKQILKTTTNTKLLIKIESYDNGEERLKYYMKFLDVDKERLIIIQKIDDNEYVQLFSKIDILLDTFPYSGTTTSCNALYNSIPIITMYNENYHVHNVTSSILINSGLPELVAKDEENYIKIACNLINDSNRINEYKKNIRGMFMNLMEPNAFMKTYEEELTKLYNKHVR
jgi:predicted O-linked N-acetylglucosamine transferase (SPINDLY family)